VSDAYPGANGPAGIGGVAGKKTFPASGGRVARAIRSNRGFGRPVASGENGRIQPAEISKVTRPQLRNSPPF